MENVSAQLYRIIAFANGLLTLFSTSRRSDGQREKNAIQLSTLQVEVNLKTIPDFVSFAQPPHLGTVWICDVFAGGIDIDGRIGAADTGEDAGTDTGTRNCFLYFPARFPTRFLDFQCSFSFFLFRPRFVAGI